MKTELESLLSSYTTLVVQILTLCRRQLLEDQAAASAPVTVFLTPSTKVVLYLPEVRTFSAPLCRHTGAATKHFRSRFASWRSTARWKTVPESRSLPEVTRTHAQSCATPSPSCPTEWRALTIWGSSAKAEEVRIFTFYLNWCVLKTVWL